MSAPFVHPLEGGVVVGDRVTRGDWTCEGITIGERAMVGAGAVVTADVEPHTVVIGNPARVVRRLEPAE